MTLNDWVGIATIVQTIFVAVSLGFIWYQLREAVRLTRTANSQRQTERAGPWQLQLAQDEHLAELWLQGTKTPEALSEVQLWRYQRLFMYTLNIYAETYHHWSEKQFDDADYSSWRTGLTSSSLRTVLPIIGVVSSNLLAHRLCSMSISSSSELLLLQHR